MRNNNSYLLTAEDIDRIVEMAWEDRTPFGAIKLQFGLSESAVITLMRQEMKSSSFKMWRQRVKGRATKHRKKRAFFVGKHKSTLQRTISFNRVSKRK